MNKGIAFITGFILGTAITTMWESWKRTKALCKKGDELEEESERLAEQADEDLDARQSEIMDEALNIMRENGYTKTTKKEFNKISPYLISENEFAEFDNYEALSFTYFADGILADEDYEIIKDPVYLVGPFENWFEGNDVIYVRCDERCADYEIARDIRTYAEVYNTLPHMKWRQNE